MNNNSRYYKPDEYNGICVVRRKNESDEDFVKRFRKKCAKSGLSKEFRDRMYYEKPSEKRRRKKANSIRLIKKEAAKLEKLKERADKFRKKQKRKREKLKRRSEHND